MSKDFQSATRSGANSDYNNTTLPPDEMAEVMACVMDYYINLSRMVKKKLEHASDATRKRIAEIEALERPGKGPISDTIKKYRELDEYWHKLIELMGQAGMMTEEIEEIDCTVESIPPTIRTYYDALVSLDQDLLDLIETLNSEDTKRAYEKAKKITATIQHGRNLMTGLTEKEYDFPHIQEPALKKQQAGNKPPPITPGNNVGYVRLPDGRKVKVLS